MELDVEISRERVPLRNAYRHVGQRTVLRVNSGEEHNLQGAGCCLGWLEKANFRGLRRMTRSTDDRVPMQPLQLRQTGVGDFFRPIIEGT